VANNTYARLDGEDVVVRYHATDIVRLREDGSVVLNSGGWHTYTTKERLNYFTTARVFQRNFKWFVRTADGVVPFSDGMVLSGDGRLVGGVVGGLHLRELEPLV
jgi:hypothetical protein